MKKLLAYFYAFLLFAIIILTITAVAFAWGRDDFKWRNALMAYGILIPLTLLVRNYVNKK